MGDRTVYTSLRSFISLLTSGVKTVPLFWRDCCIQISYLFLHNLIRWISDSPGTLFHPTSVALVLEVSQFPMYDILIVC